VIKTKIGEINVSGKMVETGSVVGGESNGGVIIPAIHPCRDSFGGMAVVLEMLASRKKTVSELRAEIPTYYTVKEKITIRSEQAPAILRSLRRQYESEKINLLDGVHVDFGDRWIHARRSNTEPVIRLTTEAPTEKEAHTLADELRQQIESAL
jgi:phosphomannomutase